MDFWSRLIANTPLAENARRDAAKDPVRRLRRFEKEYGHLLQAWRNSSNLAKDYDAAEEVEIRLQELTHILSDETRRPLPHPCIAFSATKQLYLPIAKIATTSYNEWIIKEAVLFFATLVESEEENFVESDAFAASLTNLLVKITGANSIRLGSDTEARVVELAFNITTKIRLEPNILSAWFKSQRPGGGQERATQDSRDKFEGRAQKQDFPLFYLLVDYIHHEGKVGDFARTGLLYIIEAASSSVELEQWIVESDLSTLMATGLGALYSQLSGKLVVDYSPQDLPPILALSDYQPPVPTHEIVPSTSPEFQAHLETFLSHLVFWQDVLNHCKSVEVKSTLLEHFQIIFLQQLLYPSLLESSDLDGGSSVAVLTYLRQILESLDHPDMINLILHYLLGLPDIVSATPEATSDSVSKARKRKSMDLATMMASKPNEAADRLLYTLVDLIQGCLRSPSYQTIHVTLQLVSAILRRHHRYGVTTLVRTENLYGDIRHRTVGAQQQELEFLVSLAGSIGGQDNFDEVYENILKDTTSRLESHPCSLQLLVPKASAETHKHPTIPNSLPGAPRDVRPHTIRPDDPLLTVLLDHLGLFFINPVETNLGITETILDLALCGYMNVEGWLLRDPKTYIYDNDDSYEPMAPPDDAEDTVDLDTDQMLSDDPKKLDEAKKCRRRPVWSVSDLPRLLRILQSLSDQVAAFRGSIPRFSDLLQQRREAFQIADSPAPLPPPKQPQPQTYTPGSGTPGFSPSSNHTSRSGSPIRTGLEGFAQRLLKDLNDLGTPSRSGSPRALGSSGFSYGMGTPSSNNRPPPVPPKEYHLGVDTPTKGGMTRGRSFSPVGPKAEEDHIKASQAAAFQAIDQQILARKIGLPATKSSPAPLKLGDEIGAPAKPADGEEEEDRPPPPPAKDDQPMEGDQTPVPPEERKVSVSHVLTNIVVLQSFLFELAALIQVRAGFFDEIELVKIASQEETTDFPTLEETPNGPGAVKFTDFVDSGRSPAYFGYVSVENQIAKEETDKTTTIERNKETSNHGATHQDEEIYREHDRVYAHRQTHDPPSAQDRRKQVLGFVTMAVLQENIRYYLLCERFRPWLGSSSTERMFGDLRRSLDARLARLTAEICADQDELEGVYSTLGVLAGNKTGTLGDAGKAAMRDDVTRAEIKVHLDGLLKAISRHRQEAQAIEKEMLYLLKMTKQMEEQVSAKGADFAADDMAKLKM